MFTDSGFPCSKIQMELFIKSSRGDPAGKHTRFSRATYFFYGKTPITILYNNFIGYVTIYTCIKKGYVREKLNSHKLTYPSTTLYKIQTIYIYTTTRQVILIYIQLIINL